MQPQESVWEADMFCSSWYPFSHFSPSLVIFIFSLSKFSSAPCPQLLPCFPHKPYLFIFPPLLLFIRFRHATSSFSLSLIETSTEGALWAHFLHVGPHWLTSSKEELRLHQNFCLALGYDLESTHCNRSRGGVYLVNSSNITRLCKMKHLWGLSLAEVL